jgi:hypothetical protein
MTSPRLTITIPTLDRATFLIKAIDSVLAQTVPTKIIVADQGHTDEVAQAMRRYQHHPLVKHIQSSATCLWENWDFAARAADTEFVSWLQDDDVVSRSYTAHILDAMDRWPAAQCWMARLACADEDGRALWFLGNGPWIPMKVLDREPVCFDGAIMALTAYLTSWALSPAVAFRRGPAFDEALDRMPRDTDLFAERMILAGIGLRSKVVADPVLAGYWVQHEGNENRKQHKDQDRQTLRAIHWTDSLIDELDEEEREQAFTAFDGWCAMMPVGHVMAWLQTVVPQRGRYADRIGEILLKNVQGRVEAVRPMPDAVAAGLGSDGCPTGMVPPIGTVGGTGGKLRPWYRRWLGRAAGLMGVMHA